MATLVSYDSSDEENTGPAVLTASAVVGGDTATGYAAPTASASGYSAAASLRVVAAPEVAVKEDVASGTFLEPGTNKVSYNPRYEEMYVPEVGPENPFKTRQQKAQKNMLAGFVEPAHVNAFQFETQRRTFHSYGYALDPTVDNAAGVPGTTFIGEVEVAAASKGLSVFESSKARPGDKRKRSDRGDPGKIDGYHGPWAGYVDDVKVSRPSEDQQVELDRMLDIKVAKNKQKEDKTIEEKTQLHVENALDYQGRSYLHAPRDLDVDLYNEDGPEKCFLPKRCIHTWTGHTKGVSAIRLFPKSGHLLLSASMDSKVKLWEVYNDRRLLRTFSGHSKAVRDISFNNDGTRFLTASYDRYVKMFDTETGQCIGRYTTKKIPYCVKFNPDEDKQHIFLAGTSDKKIVQWDTTSGEIMQEYDRHLGAVNTISFIDDNKRIVSTSDDKSVRVWEWEIPVDSKYIAEPSMHAVSAVGMSSNLRWMACQSSDNQIRVYDAAHKMRLNKKKIFKGHMVAGYACQVNFSPDGHYIISGDGDGNLCVWDWKSCKLFSKMKAHEEVCIGCEWLPHETSKVVTCGWDGLIKLWD